MLRGLRVEQAFRPAGVEAKKNRLQPLRYGVDWFVICIEDNSAALGG
jgi:hypothetical protein